MTIRAFIAVELDEPLRRAIERVQELVKLAIEPASHDRDHRAPHVSWVRPSSLHLTLKFLGDIDESIVPALKDEVAAAIGNHAPIDVPLSRLGGFPRLQDPRNLWLGPDDRWKQHDDARRLQMLVKAIDEICATHGIPAEARPFSPHLTLGRVKAGERQIGRALTNHPTVTESLHLPVLPITRITLMKSQLNSKGAIHTALWTLQLDR